MNLILLGGFYWEEREVFWGQQSRINWLCYGGRKSSFFHASTLQKRNQNKILRLKSLGNIWFETEINVSCHIQAFYWDLLSLVG